MAIQDLWYKNAILYCLDVDKYMDANGDGIGDFEGLSRRLEYLHGLGVTCLWFQPFYPTPNRDNGYDVTDFYGVNTKHGSPGDFVECMNHAKALGMRVIVDLVVNHTSIDHPWFQRARGNPQSPFRDWYVWTDDRPPDHEEGVVFPGVQRSTWTFDEAAGMWYFHRFYEHQPDLNTHNPAVRDEIMRIMGYWLELGVSGFRMDAVPFLIERKGPNVDPEKDFALLHDMRTSLSWRRGDAIMLAEANVPPEESIKYFGDEGDHLQMMLNFPVNQRLWYALATGETGPLVWALQQTAKRPQNAQWVHFLRSHDERDLGRRSRLSPESDPRDRPPPPRAQPRPVERGARHRARAALDAGGPEIPGPRTSRLQVALRRRPPRPRRRVSSGDGMGLADRAVRGRLVAGAPSRPRGGATNTGWIPGAPGGGMHRLDQRDLRRRGTLPPPAAASRRPGASRRCYGHGSKPVVRSEWAESLQCRLTRGSIAVRGLSQTSVDIQFARRDASLDHARP